MLSLKDGKIVRQWSALLAGCQGEGPGVLKAVEKILESYNVPGLSWKQESASTGFIKGLMGKRRDFLVVYNEQFSEWLVCIGARDYGAFLSVVWYLTAAPKFLNKMRSTSTGEVLIDELDVFDQQDVNAYAAVTRMAVEAATNEFKRRDTPAVARPGPTGATSVAAAPPPRTRSARVTRGATVCPKCNGELAPDDDGGAIEFCYHCGEDLK